MLPDSALESAGTSHATAGRGCAEAAFSLAQALNTPILGYLSDRFGRRPVLWRQRLCIDLSISGNRWLIRPSSGVMVTLLEMDPPQGWKISFLLPIERVKLLVSSIFQPSNSYSMVQNPMKLQCCAPKAGLSKTFLHPTPALVVSMQKCMGSVLAVYMFVCTCRHADRRTYIRILQTHICTYPHTHTRRYIFYRDD